MYVGVTRHAMVDRVQNAVMYGWFTYGGQRGRNAMADRAQDAVMYGWFPYGGQRGRTAMDVEGIGDAMARCGGGVCVALG